MVPNGWKIASLKEATVKIQDGNYGASYPKKEELLPSGIPFLTSKVLGGEGKINTSKYDYISLKKHAELKKAQITTDDILFTNRGANVGTVAMAGKDLADANIGPQLTLIRANEQVSDKKYLYLFMKSNYFLRQVHGQDSGSAMNFFGIKSTEKFKVILPPLPEQRKMAKILSTWDKAISTTERLIDNSKQQKKALMQQLLTGKKRLLDDSGKQFEGEWEEVKLSNVVEVVMGSSPKSASYNENSEGLPLIQGNADIKNRKSAPRIYTSEVTKKCGVGDILLSVRAPVGTIAKSEHEACIGRGISAISAKKHHVQEYLYQWLLWFEPRWEKYSQGSTFEAVNSNDIKSLHLAIPEHSEQAKIASVLSNADQEIELLEQQLADLKQEKKALMQQLLTGKRRVALN
jgi:type I restriction enzyme S subunit